MASMCPSERTAKCKVTQMVLIFKAVFKHDFRLGCANGQASLTYPLSFHSSTSLQSFRRLKYLDL